MLSFHSDPALKERSLTEEFPFESETLGIPSVIGRFRQRILQGLPEEVAPDFPRQFLEAVPVGKDLSPVHPLMMRWLLERPLERSNGMEEVRNVANLFDRRIAGETIEEEEWLQAAEEAYQARYKSLYPALAAQHSALSSDTSDFLRGAWMATSFSVMSSLRLTGSIAGNRTLFQAAFLPIREKFLSLLSSHPSV